MFQKQSLITVQTVLLHYQNSLEIRLRFEMITTQFPF